MPGIEVISEAITNKLAVQEGVFLYTHNVSPYDGGVYHQAPLLLPLFSLLPNPSSSPLATNLLYTVVDLLSANALAQVAESGFAAETRLFASSRKNLRWSSVAIAAGYAQPSLIQCFHVLIVSQLSVQSFHGCDLHCPLDFGLDKPLYPDSHG